MTRKSKSATSRSHEEATVESFRKDPAFAVEYLNSILEDWDQEESMLALRRMSKAFSGVQKLAEEAELNVNSPAVKIGVVVPFDVKGLCRSRADRADD